MEDKVSFEYYSQGVYFDEVLPPRLLEHTHAGYGHSGCTVAVGLCGDEVFPHTAPERNLAYHNAHQMIAQGFHL